MAVPSYGNNPKIFVLVVVTLLCTRNVYSFKCWLCKDGAASFDLCDQKKQIENCAANLDRCGTFSFIDANTQSRIYAKSCTSAALCSGNNTFCSNIPGGGKDCRVQCCATDLCNFVVGFATTVAPTTAPAAPPTTTEQPSTTKSPTTTTTQTTTNNTTQEPTPVGTDPPTTSIVHPTNDGHGDDDDDDDCSWVDSSSSALHTKSISVIGLVLLIFSIN